MSLRVVAIGGGHGLAASLRAIRRYSTDITAIVSVADDGGSTGRLRGATAMPAPGDIRKCLTALAGTDAPIVSALEHRFAGGDVEGHSLGNLVLAALTAEIGDPLAAIAEVGRLVRAVGRVLPAASEPVALVGVTTDGTEIRGQVEVMRTKGIRSVWVDPARPRVSAEVGSSILTADQVVIGPGSLYTSILAATAVDEVRDALHDTSAQKVYVCNLRPQLPETEGYGVIDHVEALRRHGVAVDVVLYDPATIGEPGAGHPDVDFRAAPLAVPNGAAHDAARLSAALSEVAEIPRIGGRPPISGAIDAHSPGSEATTASTTTTWKAEGS